MKIKGSLELLKTFASLDTFNTHEYLVVVLFSTYRYYCRPGDKTRQAGRGGREPAPAHSMLWELCSFCPVLFYPSSFGCPVASNAGFCLCELLWCASFSVRLYEVLSDLSVDSKLVENMATFSTNKSIMCYYDFMLLPQIWHYLFYPIDIYLYLTIVSINEFTKTTNNILFTKFSIPSIKSAISNWVNKCCFKVNGQ